MRKEERGIKGEKVSFESIRRPLGLLKQARISPHTVAFTGATTC